MSRARTLATVLGSDGMLGASDITTALGYTPVNKAGDTMTGTLNIAAIGGGLSLNADAFEILVDVPFNGSNYDGAATQRLIRGYDKFSHYIQGHIDIGTDGVGTSNQWWFIQFPTFNYYTQSFVIELTGGTWNWSQVAFYARWHIGAFNGSMTVNNLESVNASNMSVSAKAFNHNTPSGFQRIAVRNTAGRGNFGIRIRSHNTTPFANGIPNTAYTNSDPTA